MVRTRRAFHSKRSFSARFSPHRRAVLQPVPQQVLGPRRQQLIQVADQARHAVRGRLEGLAVLGMPRVSSLRLQLC